MPPQATETGGGSSGAATGAKAKQKRRRQMLVIGAGAALLVLIMVMRARSASSGSTGGPTQADLQNAADQAAQNQAAQDQAAMGGGIPSAFGGTDATSGLTAGDIADAVTSGIENAGITGTGPSTPQFALTINNAGKPHTNGTRNKGKTTGKGTGTRNKPKTGSGKPNTPKTGHGSTQQGGHGHKHKHHHH